MAADLSTVGQWTNKYPFDKIAGGKSLWDQPGVQAAMRAVMGKRFFTLSQKEMQSLGYARHDLNLTGFGT
jgi:hypothetical protein